MGAGFGFARVRLHHKSIEVKARRTRPMLPIRMRPRGTAVWTLELADSTAEAAAAAASAAISFVEAP